jgi:hypothetical protein
VYDQVHRQVRGQVDGQVGGQVRAQVAAQVYDQVRDQVYDQVHRQVRGQVHGQVRDQVAAQVAAQVGGQVDDQVRDQVGGQVYDQVYDQVDDQVYADALRHYFGGQFWAGGWGWGPAFVSYFTDVCGLELPDDIAAKAAAYRATVESGCWWFPYQDFVVLVDRPNEIHLDNGAGGFRRLHREDGPAISWDGWALHFWHGTPVPAQLIEQGWATERILREPNAEVRRCAIEMLGWDQFIIDAELALIDEQPDPGNPGQTIALFDVPEQVYDEPVRVILVTNGSPERDGTRRRFGLTVPDTISDALTAAAWTYDLPRDQYAQLARRT